MNFITGEPSSYIDESDFAQAGNASLEGAFNPGFDDDRDYMDHDIIFNHELILTVEEEEKEAPMAKKRGRSPKKPKKNEAEKEQPIRATTANKSKTTKRNAHDSESTPTNSKIVKRPRNNINRSQSTAKIDVNSTPKPQQNDFKPQSALIKNETVNQNTLQKNSNFNQMPPPDNSNWSQNPPQQNDLKPQSILIKNATVNQNTPQQNLNFNQMPLRDNPKWSQNPPQINFN